MIPALQRVLLALCLVCMASAARAEERTSPIRDEAELFHADTILRAEQQIEDIRRTYDRNLFVDTVKSASPRERKLFRFLWTRQVNRILEEHARKRASESKVDGIYVVICNDPKDVHVIVRPADDDMFTQHDSEELRRSLARRLQDSGPDPALLAMTNQVRATLQAHAMRGRSTSVVNEFVLAGLLGGGVALWLLLCGVRFKMQGKQARSLFDESAPQGSRRTPALLGAMFGFPAGQWIYDKLYPNTPRTPELTIALEDDAVEKTEVESPPVDESPEDAPVAP
ncbi:MAG TPA: hypothetical protein VN688_13830 [Gemmataceae bacterium]|nr:hypothetical protein [Gemmataceae bacterium]